MSVYKIRLGNFQSALKKVKQKHGTVSLLRLLAFLLLAFSWFYIITIHLTLGLVMGSSLVVLFFVLLKWHKRIEDKRDFLKQLCDINQQELDSLQGNYQSFPAGDAFVDHSHPYSYDMDLFGSGSLFQYLNRTISIGGEKKLARWLSQTPLPTVSIIKHQQAIHELAPQIDLRQHFRAYGSLIKTDETEDQFIKNWLQLPSFFDYKKWAAVYLWLVPILNLSLIGLAIGGVFPGILVLYLILANLALVGSKFKRFNKAYVLLNKSHNSLKKMLQLLRLSESVQAEAPLLKELKADLFHRGIPASKQIQQLTKLLDALDNRNNLIVGLILNSLLLWDWNLLFRIERWQKSHQPDYEKWQETLSYFDALYSLAGFAFNHPDYIYAELSQADFEFEAQQIGHPLLPAQVRICNDFSLNQSPRYAIITGANMAGKSTFLRTIATNLVLAGCGAPVCAKQLRFTPLPLHSSMRAEDSLMKNESYFFAELKRLQRITQELDKGEKLFIILDEILRGTNSEDKRKGSIGFVKKITSKQAYGLVATHDLELARLAEQQPDIFKALCFEVAIKNNELQFDYKLQPGLTKNMNASFLMKQMGIID
ncbi:MAG: hypothetical protein AB7S69_04000 [Salinivirgaceae bacterium]